MRPSTAFTNAEAIEGTLRWCNEMRALDGAEPLPRLPRGLQEDPTSCPCGRATGLSVSSRYAYHPDRPRLELPDVVHAFVMKFDTGAIPELIDRPGVRRLLRNLRGAA